ncbi:MAG: single-stranded DNA-binding protein [Selenomonadaceae bacterium]|nr:single-stranded DNA-binding protein [Selenomonadaceae bacterium]
MNSVILSGRVATEVNFRVTKKGKAVATFLLAVPNRMRKKNEDGSIPTDFPRIQAWGKIAEICRDYLIRGKECLIHGIISTNTYEKNNQKIYNIFVTANTVEFLGYQKQVNGDDNSSVSDDNEIISSEVGMPPISDEELPF